MLYGILNSIGDVYKSINALSYFMLEWFNSPVSDDIVDLLNLTAGITNIELLIGSFIPVALLFTLIGLIKKGLSPL